MKRSHGLLFALWLGSTGGTQAATEFGENVPAELAAIFAGLVPGQSGMYADITETFPAFTLPAGFTVLGSVEREPGKTAYLRTELGDEEAREALKQAFVAGGWTSFDPFGPAMGNGAAGFVGAGTVARAYPAMLCHDELGNMQVNTVQGAYTVMILSYTDASMMPGQRCSEMVANRLHIAARRNPYRNLSEQYLPRLELPAEGSAGRMAGSTGGISGSGDEITANTSMQVSWEPLAVREHFASQIAAQGWTKDGEWLTGMSAGTSWTRKPAEGGSLLGIFTAVRKEPGNYTVEFRLIPVTALAGD